MSKRDTPDEETNDWRAVCGRTARTVRRAGRAQTLPDPYREIVRHQVAVRALAEGAIDVAQPKGRVPPLGEALLAAETPRQIEKNVEVGPSTSLRKLANKR